MDTINPVDIQSAYGKDTSKSISTDNGKEISPSVTLTDGGFTTVDSDDEDYESPDGYTYDEWGQQYDSDGECTGSWDYFSPD